MIRHEPRIVRLEGFLGEARVATNFERVDAGLQGEGNEGVAEGVEGDPWKPMACDVPAEKGPRVVSQGVARRVLVRVQHVATRNAVGSQELDDEIVERDLPLGPALGLEIIVPVVSDGEDRPGEAHLKPLATALDNLLDAETAVKPEDQDVSEVIAMGGRDEEIPLGGGAKSIAPRLPRGRQAEAEGGVFGDHSPLLEPREKRGDVAQVAVGRRLRALARVILGPDVLGEDLAIPGAEVSASEAPGGGRCEARRKRLEVPARGPGSVAAVGPGGGFVAEKFPRPESEGIPTLRPVDPVPLEPPYGLEGLVEVPGVQRDPFGARLARVLPGPRRAVVVPAPAGGEAGDARRGGHGLIMDHDMDHQQRQRRITAFYHPNRK